MDLSKCDDTFFVERVLVGFKLAVLRYRVMTLALMVLL